MQIVSGIDDMAFQAPALYLPIEELAEARKIEAGKLKSGLGLKSMSMCDVDEDVVTLASGAALRLLEQNPNIRPEEIGRIYIGTESSIDGSKPIGSYVHEILNQYFKRNSEHENPLMHADVIDMTFACIGAVDAMHNSLYYVQANPNSYAIVIAADIADYELDSTGEYTQGAGAVAILISTEPRLLAIDDRWGVSMKSEHDFFKPIRLKTIGGETIQVHDDKPIFDGQFSNETYKKRIEEAWSHFRKNEMLSDYSQLIFHLPYAFHGRRIITTLLLEELSGSDTLNEVCSESQIDLNAKGGLRAFSKTEFYSDWINTRIAPGERLSSDMGNLYTASIFLSLMSSLEFNSSNAGDSILLIAYGSGSKSKVFQANLQIGFQSIVDAWESEKSLSKRTAINFKDYINLREKNLSTPIHKGKRIQKVASGITVNNRFERTYQLTLNS